MSSKFHKRDSVVTMLGTPAKVVVKAGRHGRYLVQLLKSGIICSLHGRALKPVCFLDHELNK
jgi:hypothetical protein